MRKIRKARKQKPITQNNTKIKKKRLLMLSTETEKLKMTLK